MDTSDSGLRPGKPEMGLSENSGTVFGGPYNKGPTIKGTLFWGPYNKDPTIKGTLFWGPYNIIIGSYYLAYYIRVPYYRHNPPNSCNQGGMWEARASGHFGFRGLGFQV